MSVDIDIVPLFSSPLIYCMIDDDTDVLQDSTHEFEETGYGNGSSQTINRRVLKDYPEIEKILLNTWKEIAKGFFTYTDEFAISTSWFTRVKHGQSCQWHLHKNSFWSGVYYFEDYEQYLSAQLEFETPLITAPDYHIIPKEHNSYSAKTWSIPPKKGKLVLFPSYMKHRITRHDSMYPRTSLAFNIIPIGNYGDSDSTYNTDWT